MQFMKLHPDKDEKDEGPPIDFRPPTVMSSIFVGLFVLLLLYGFLA